MNIREAINLIENTNDLNLETAKQFWAKEQGKSVSDDQTVKFVYNSIKLAKSLASRDQEKKYIDPDTMELLLRTVAEKKVRKADPYTLWVDIIDKDGKVVLSFTYSNFTTGLSTVLDGNGKQIVAGKGWKKIRDFFRTGENTAEEKKEKTSPAKKATKSEKVASEKPLKKAAAKAKVKTTKSGMVKQAHGVLVNPPAEQVIPEQEQTWVEPVIPDIPEELQ